MKTMGFIEALESVVVKNYANFSGRARRSEYWYFALANFIFGTVTGLMSVALRRSTVLLNQVEVLQLKSLTSDKDILL